MPILLDGIPSSVSAADATPILPPHIEETVRAIAQLHAEHYSGASTLQRLVDRLTSIIGRPAFVGFVFVAVLLWVLGNALAPAAGVRPFDRPPFAWLQGTVGLLALYVTVLILTTQRREDQLAGYREQLTLELAILSEQKSAKIIELLEEMRRDNPLLPNRVDKQAEALSMPADPQSVLEALKNTHEELASDTVADTGPADDLPEEPPDPVAPA